MFFSLFFTSFKIMILDCYMVYIIACNDSLYLYQYILLVLKKYKFYLVSSIFAEYYCMAKKTCLYHFVTCFIK